MVTVKFNSTGPTSDSADPAFTGIDVGVIGIAEPRTRQSWQPAARSSWSAMDDYADLIGDQTPIRALRFPWSRSGAPTVADRICALSSRVSAVFVIGLGTDDSATVHRAVVERGGPLMIAELDVVTAALAAAALTTLRSRGIAPGRGRVVIAGSQSAPDLGPVLVGSGVAMITSWHDRDAEQYPLPRLMDSNDVLVDLRGSRSDAAAPGRTLLYPAAPFDYGALALPGLLSAVCGHDIDSLTVDMLASAARAIALVTPAERVLPTLNEPVLVQAVARQVAGVLGEQATESP